MDKDTLFLDYLTKEFFPKELERCTSKSPLIKPISYKHYEERKRRLTDFLITPKSKAVSKCSIRSTKVGYLQPDHFEELFEVLVSEGISPSYYRLLRTDFSVALGAIFKRLPITVPDYFRGIVSPRAKRTKKKYYEPLDIFRVLADDTKSVSARALIALEFLMLCRPSEIGALDVSDINWKTGLITFNKALRKTGANEFTVLEDTKGGEASNRAFVMPQLLFDLLKQHAQGKSPSDALFTTDKGHRLTNFKLKGHWTKIQRELGLAEGVSFYSLKSSGNSYYLSKGMTPEALRILMGHTKNSEMVNENYRVLVKHEEDRRHAIVDEAVSQASQVNFPFSGQISEKD